MRSNGTQETRIEEIGNILGNFRDPFDGWECIEVKKKLGEEYAEWISQMAEWKSFITLTFENEIALDSALKKWKWLVKTLNEKAIGKNYIRKVGHSYFSYILAIEKQSRGVLHFHALADRAMDFKLIHYFWSKNCGFAWADKTEDQRKVVAYVTKYIVKGGELIAYLTKNNYQYKIQLDLLD